MLVKQRRIALPALAAFSLAAISLSSCSTADTAESPAAPEAPSSPGAATTPPESAFPVAAPDPGEAELVSKIHDPDGGTFAVHGLKSASEAVTLQAACGRTGTITIEMANIEPVELSCGPESGHHSLKVDIRPAAGALDVTVFGTEGAAWGVTIAEAELP